MPERQRMPQAIVATSKARFEDVLCRQHQLLLTFFTFPRRASATHAKDDDAGVSTGRGQDGKYRQGA